MLGPPKLHFLSSVALQGGSEPGRHCATPLALHRLIFPAVDAMSSPPSHRPLHVLLPPGLIAEQFLETTAAQLTYHGLCELTAAAKEGELGVFFRNNHFSTMIKHKVTRAGSWGPVCPRVEVQEGN